jgi:hypothetical protein
MSKSNLRPFTRLHLINRYFVSILLYNSSLKRECLNRFALNNRTVNAIVKVVILFRIYALYISQKRLCNRVR